VEDPPEYPIPGAIQTPVTNAETEEERRRQFQKAIQATMRLDPDIILIGEIRDPVSAALAIEAASTGHQVWTTLHANNAFAIFARLQSLKLSMDMVTDPSIISSLSCQRLIKELCPKCKLPYHEHAHLFSEDQKDRLMAAAEEIRSVRIRNPKGCDHCSGTGIVGRTVVAETIITDQTLMDHIRRGDKLAAMHHWRTRQGGVSMIEHELTKINAGIADPFDVEDSVGELSVLDIESDNVIDAAEISNQTANPSHATLDDYIKSPSTGDAAHEVRLPEYAEPVDNSSVMLSEDEFNADELFFNSSNNG
jgi:type II secretory ATPase GspE/PulE/Tfp pilus assembly ATPase PilB-like protein